MKNRKAFERRKEKSKNLGKKQLKIVTDQFGIGDAEVRGNVMRIIKECNEVERI